MPFSSNPKVQIVDASGDKCDDDSGKLNVRSEVVGHPAVSHVAVNVTDSAVVLPTAGCKHADIMANLSNTGIVYIGASGVDATTGIALYAGDVYSVDVENLNLLYVISTVSGDDLNIVRYT